MPYRPREPPRYPRGVRLALLGHVTAFCLAGCLPAPPEAPPAREPQPRAMSLALDDASARSAANEASDAPSRARSGDGWTDCYAGFEPSSDPVSDLARLTAACAAPARMRPVTPVHVGHAADEGAPPEKLAFRARRGRCYRAFAVGAPDALDVDVALYDPEGRIAAGDVSRDRFPVVPPRGPLCAPRSGVYTVAIAITRGRGDYVFQIWGTRERDQGDDDEDEDGN